MQGTSVQPPFTRSSERENLFLGNQNENTPDESDNIHGGRIVRIAEKVHQREYHTCGNLGEFDSHDMDGLDQKLAILRILSRKYLSRNP